jgi:tripartite-type tricarboxylate transporter receptor subunit TctC
MRMFAALMVGAALAAGQNGALAQAYPLKPVRVVIPFPPGAGLDVTGRLIAQRMSANLGQPFVVENRAGAGGVIGEEHVSKSPPDGYTLLFTPGSETALRMHTTRNPAIDPLKDLTPIATAVATVTCLVARTSLPIGSLKELIDHARRNPGKLSYGSSGIGSGQHLAGEVLKQLGVELYHVPFKGLTAAVQAAAADQIDLVFTNFANAQPLIQAGKLRPMAVLRNTRYAGTPDVPAMNEEMPGFSMAQSWFGFFGPRALPQPLVQRINGEIARVLETPELSARMREFYLDVLITPAERMPGFVRDNSDAFGKVVKAAGIPPSD